MILNNRHWALALGAVAAATTLVAGCAKTSSSSSVGATSASVAAIQAGVQAVGRSMAASSFTLAGAVQPMNVSAANCDAHGYPVVNQSDGHYPGHLTYCFTSIDQGDTVIGGFDTPVMVGCLIDHLNVTYDGAPHTLTITTAIINACNAGGGSGLTDGTTVTATASAPASFNSHFSKGVVLDMSSSFGLIFKIATNLEGAKTSFLTNENWSDGSIGTTAGTLDISTGDLWYESRVERMNCTTSGRCGWSRHTRIRAGLTMSGGLPTGLSSISFGYSNVQTTPGQSGFGGTLITAVGNLTTGIKARLWQATNGSSGSPSGVSDYNTVSKWVETTNTNCYTHGSETAGTCGAGLAKFSTNTNFLLNTTDTHTSVASWFGSLTGQTFTNADIDADIQF